MRSLPGLGRLPRCSAALALAAALAWAVWTPPCAGAQDAKPVLVVIQSGIGFDGGAALRGQLAQQFGLEVISVRSAQLGQEAPPAMMAIALDDRAVINAIYWDRDGGFDRLSAPAPKQPEAMQTAAVTLAAALLQRHIAALTSGAGAAPVSEVAATYDAQLRAAYLSGLLQRERAGRLGIELRVEDF